VYTTFVVPRELEDKLAVFLQKLQDSKADLGVTDMQMSLTTLEQVFLTIAKEAEKQSAAAEGRTLTLELPLGGGQSAKVEVPWGGEQGEYQGEPVEVHWLQDDEGRLQYAHHIWRGEKIAQQAVTKHGCCGCC
jgi:hypothetical protein